MAQYTEFGHKAFVASAAISQYARVKGTRQSDGSIKISAAGVTDKDLGVATRQTFADGDVVDVKLRTAPGTVQMIAASSMNALVEVYTAASGKVDDAQATGALPLGQTLQDASGDGSIIEVLRYADVS